MISYNKQCEDVYVLDTTAFYAGISIIGNNKFYTTPLVISEIPNNNIVKCIIPELIERGELRVIQPSSYFIEYVERVASKSGDINKLSNTDLSVLSLAIQLKKEKLKPIIVSDDFAVQNLSLFLGLEFSRVSTKSISSKIEWLIYCSGCGRTFKNEKISTCDFCGTKLKRKAKIKGKIYGIFFFILMILFTISFKLWSWVDTKMVLLLII